MVSYTKTVHGEFRFGMAGDRVVLVSATGAWNLECGKAYCREFSDVVAPLLDGDSWASLTLLDDWGLAVSEVRSMFQDIHQWTGLNGRSNACFVLKSALKRHELSRYFMHDLSGADTMVVDTLAEGIEHLEKAGFVISQQRVNEFLRESA